MRTEGLPDLFINTFARYYERLVRGETGLIPESEIRPIDDLPDAQQLGAELEEAGHQARKHTVLIKLNGGLGTSMGLERAKSLLAVRNGLTFLDIIARQAIHAGVPLALMNSFATDTDSRKAVERYPELRGNLPLGFLQHKEPKIDRSDLSPVSWPRDRSLEWCPPGHGDLYMALVTSGMLDALLEAGYVYAFVANADNLGATLDDPILGFFARNEIPFLMEVADRTEMDKKGGHLARRPDGRLVLRESAQCPPEDMDHFQDVRRHRFFNTNNLWLDLRALQALLKSRDYRLELPMIRNAKTVDPRDPDSTPVYQLETAMGAAVSVFEGARAIRVPRTRFAPVKTTNELLAVRSDAYELTEDFRIVPNPERDLPPPHVQLDSRYYKLLADFESRFPHGAPSLVACASLEVRGDFHFGRDVVIEGDATLVNDSGEQVALPDGITLRGETRYPRS